jgi:hypothetical protein
LFGAKFQFRYQHIGQIWRWYSGNQQITDRP